MFKCKICGKVTRPGEKQKRKNIKRNRNCSRNKYM